MKNVVTIKRFDHYTDTQDQSFDREVKKGWTPGNTAPKRSPKKAKARKKR